jgi:tRNA modification GTPase
VTNVRHVEALQKAYDAITKVKQQISEGISGDIISLDLHACIDALAEIVGGVTCEDTLHAIFSRFCVGK